MRYLALFLILCSCLIPATAQNYGPAKSSITTFDCPTYPPKAEAMGLQGMVELQVTTDGHRVTNIKLISGHPVLAQAAEENVNTWQFADHAPTTFPVTYFFIHQSDSEKESATPEGGSKCSAKMDLPNTVTVTTRAPFPACANCDKTVEPLRSQQPHIPAGSARWTEVQVPFKPTNITATGTMFWLCGPHEGIASSADGGNTWALKHQEQGGKTLLGINFTDGKIGHAGGEAGLLLSTSDAGENWSAQTAGEKAVQAFSFADADNGIVLLSDERHEPSFPMLDQVQGAAFLNSEVQLTNDGGKHWRTVSALKTDDQLRLYTELFSVAMLDSRNALVAIRRPKVALGFAVTTDGGTSWKLVQIKDVYATQLFVHDGEYWTFGIEYLNRQNHGGYGVPVSLHAKDGVTWEHGVRGPGEFWSCNSQGCYLWDGTVEDLYGKHERFFALPQDGTMTKIWAIAGDRACTIGETTKCGPAIVTQQPQPRPQQD